MEEHLTQFSAADKYFYLGVQNPQIAVAAAAGIFPFNQFNLASYYKLTKFCSPIEICT
jgi:hypothetical protein